MRRENENKVLFGMKELYIGTYTENADGTVTMGEPYHQTGAVGFSPEEQGSNYNFYADDGVYYSYYTTGRFEGDLVVARFDREFRTLFMGERMPTSSRHRAIRALKDSYSTMDLLVESQENSLPLKKKSKCRQRQCHSLSLETILLA